MKKNFKSQVVLKNGLKLTVRGLVKEIHKFVFKITSTSQKWP